MSEYNKIAEGTITVAAAGVAQTLNLPFVPISFEMWNKTQWGTASQLIRATGFAEDTAGTAYLESNSGGGLDTPSVITANGFSFVKAGSPTYGPVIALATTFVSQAGSALVTTASPHGLAVGDVAFIYGTTAMLQIAGIAYTVLTVPTTTTFTIAVNSSGFASAATSGFMKKVLYPNLYLPGNRYITAITSSGVNTVVTTAVNHNMVVGQEVAFTIPPQWGMTQLDQAAIAAANPQTKIYVTAVTANTVTCNIDSSAFTAFAYPTSAVAALGMTFPQITPIGDQNSGGLAPGGVLTSLTIPGAFQTNTFQGVVLGSSLMVNTNDVWHYRAIYPDLIANM
jgi:hypothetical protein